MLAQAKQLPGYFRVKRNANLVIYNEKHNCQLDWKVRPARPAHSVFVEKRQRKSTAIRKAWGGS